MAQRVIALAATVALVAGAAVWLSSGGGRVEQPIAENPPAPRVGQPQEGLRSAPPTLAEAPSARRAVVSPSAGREPTPYERLMFTVDVRQAEAVETSRVARAVDAAIEQLAADSSLAVDQLAEASAFTLPQAEERLLRRLSGANPRQAAAIVRLLGEFGAGRSTPALLRAAHQESLRPAALAAIERVAGVAGLADVARQTRDWPVRQEVFEHLLTADSDAALRAFLAVLPNQSIREDALAAADATANPPTARLLALLKDEDKQVRLSAAMVLGRLNGPQVTAALIAIVTDEPAAPTEAWLALLACRGPSAEQFLASASQHPRMLGQVNNARLTLARMVQ